MSNHRNMPLYKATVQLTAMIVNVTRKADRGYRFTIGEEMIRTASYLTMDFYRAYNEKDNIQRVKLINGFISHLEQLREWLDVAHELGFFSFKSYPQVAEQYASIERQVNGWLNGTAKVSVTKR